MLENSEKISVSFLESFLGPWFFSEFSVNNYKEKYKKISTNLKITLKMTSQILKKISRPFLESLLGLFFQNFPPSFCHLFDQLSSSLTFSAVLVAPPGHGTHWKQ